MKKAMSSLWDTLAYIMLSIFYLGRLHILNSELNKKGFENPLKLLEYNDHKPIKFFFIALAYALVGGYIIFRKYLILKDDDYEWYDKFFGIISIILVGIMLLMILMDINVPILRAIFSVMIIGGLFVSGLTQ